MNTKLYTQSELEVLRNMPKRVTNPRARWVEKPKRRPSIANATTQQKDRKELALGFICGRT